jgi:predicted rRNA methylase YqxC with S4 and FtsJ domains
LLKPQFEAKRSDVPRGGVIVNENIRAMVHKDFLKWLLFKDWILFDSLDSPVLGARGNREILISLATPSRGAVLC